MDSRSACGEYMAIIERYSVKSTDATLQRIRGKERQVREPVLVRNHYVMKGQDNSTSFCQTSGSIGLEATKD
jgi:hypothetical protein